MLKAEAATNKDCLATSFFGNELDESGSSGSRQLWSGGAQLGTVQAKAANPSFLELKAPASDTSPSPQVKAC